MDVADAAAQEQPFYLTEIGQPCPKERELIGTLDECSYAAATLGLPDASASLVIQSHQASRTAGCLPTLRRQAGGARVQAGEQAGEPGQIRLEKTAERMSHRDGLVRGEIG